VLRANGSAFPGQIADSAGTTAPTGWLICDGSLISRTGVNADLFAAIGTTWGAGDGSTTFALPNFKNRFRRHRDTSGVASIVGTLQASQNQTHTHLVAGTTANENATHFHTFGGNTSAMSANATHSPTYNNSNGLSTGVTGGGGFGLPTQDTGGTTGSTNIDHTHSFS
jgi:microcystin-dependent protein